MSQLLASAPTLGLERHLARPKRGIPSLAVSLLRLVLAWRGSGRPDHLRQCDEPLLAALIRRAGSAPPMWKAWGASPTSAAPSI